MKKGPQGPFFQLANCQLECLVAATATAVTTATAAATTAATASAAAVTTAAAATATAATTSTAAATSRRRRSRRHRCGEDVLPSDELRSRPDHGHQIADRSCR